MVCFLLEIFVKEKKKTNRKLLRQGYNCGTRTIYETSRFKKVFDPTAYRLLSDQISIDRQTADLIDYHEFDIAVRLKRLKQVENRVVL